MPYKENQINSSIENLELDLTPFCGDLLISLGLREALRPCE